MTKFAKGVWETIKVAAVFGTVVALVIAVIAIGEARDSTVDIKEALEELDRKLIIIDGQIEKTDAQIKSLDNLLEFPAEIFGDLDNQFRQGTPTPGDNN